jgi:hypothetical protein
MIKLLICKSATVLFGVLAIGILARLHPVTQHLHHGDLLGAALGLLGAIFGTQWIEYRKQPDTSASQRDQC